MLLSVASKSLRDNFSTAQPGFEAIHRVQVNSGAKPSAAAKSLCVKVPVKCCFFKKHVVLIDQAANKLAEATFVDGCLCW